MQEETVKIRWKASIFAKNIRAVYTQQHCVDMWKKAVYCNWSNLHQWLLTKTLKICFGKKREKKAFLSPFHLDAKLQVCPWVWHKKTNSKIHSTTFSIMQHELLSVWGRNQELIWTVDPEIWAHHWANNLGSEDPKMGRKNHPQRSLAARITRLQFLRGAEYVTRCYTYGCLEAIKGEKPRSPLRCQSQTIICQAKRKL